MSKPTLARLLRRTLWYGTALALILAALLLTAVRLLLPYADDHRAQVETWVSGYLGQPVQIEAMDARLLRLSPTLILRQVRLLDLAGEQPVARFGEIHIGLSTLASLRARRLVMSELTVVGAQLVVERHPDGAFRIEGIALPTTSGPAPATGEGASALGAWLFGQERLALRDSGLVWRDLSPGGETLHFEQVALELNNDGERHRLSGSLKLPSGLGAGLTVAADVTGDPLAPGGAAGQVYLQAERVRPSGVLRFLAVERVRADAGEVNLRFWGHWDGRALVRAEGEFQASRLLVDGGQGPVTLEQASGYGRWMADAGGWQLEMADLRIARGGREWDPARLSLRVGGEEDYRLRADFLRLEDLAAVAALLPLDQELRQTLAQRAPSGDLRKVELVRSGGELRAQGHFEDLSLRPAGTEPGFDGLDGSAWLAHGEVGVTLATRAARLDLPGLFRDPLRLTRLDGSLHWRPRGAGWLLESDGLELANADISGRARLRLSQVGDQSPFLDLSGEFRDGRASSTYKYLPAGIMPVNAVAWLDRAFRGGRVVEGGVVVHGPLDRFPYDHGEGRFQVRFSTRDVELDYMPNWPRLRGIAAEVEFDGRRMVIEASRARLLESQVTRTTVTIPDLLNARLLVQGQVQGALADLFGYLRQTDLAGHFGPTLARLSPHGESRLDLDLALALMHVENGPPDRYGGALSFLDAGLGVAAGVELEGIRGSVQFEGSDYSGAGIEARLFGAPVAVQVTSEGSGEQAHTRLGLAGGLEAAVAAKALGWPVLAPLAGSTGWHGELLLAHAAAGESALHLRSDLAGLGSTLPAPLDKTAEAQAPLELSLWFSGSRAGQLALALDQRLNAVLELAEGRLNRAAFHFGSKRPELPAAPALKISGRLPRFAPGEWSGFLPAGSGGGKPLPLVLEMEELGLVEGGEDTSEAAADPQSWPPLDVRVERFTLGAARLGQLSFQTRAIPGQVLIRDLRVQGPALTLEGYGFARYGAQPYSRLQLKLQSPDMGRLSTDLGVASVVRRGRLDLATTLEWPGPLTSPDLARLKGELSLKMEDGIIEEVDPGAGRLIGLLSLQALPQRLLLDFRDLFEKGMRFRRIQGRFDIDEGEARTDNLRMETLPAQILVTGRTGLARRDYDQTITVIPDVAATLPVAGGLAMGPQVGAVLLLFQGLFKSQIDDAAQFRYRITGPWENPVVQRLDKR